MILMVLAAQGPAATLPVVVTAASSIGAESTIVAAAIVTVIAALVTGIVSVVNAVSAAADRRASRTERAQLAATTAATDHKADTIIEKATEIHTLTNSNLSKVTAALEVANERIHGLEKLMATMLANTAADAVVRARAEVPPDTGARNRRSSDQPPLAQAEPVKVEVVNAPDAPVPVTGTS